MKTRAILFQNGSIGDFLMTVYLCQMLWKSGRFSRIEIIVPRNAGFLRGLVALYPYISVRTLSLVRPGQLLRLLRGKKITILQPTVGRVPARVKLFAWLITRGKGSELLGFQDTGPLCSLYTSTLAYDTNKPYIETVRDMARALGVAADVAAPSLECEDAPEALAAYGLARAAYVVFHPSASNPKRMFAPADAARVIDACAVLGVQVVLSGGPEERAWLEVVMSAAYTKESIKIAAGLPARELATLVKHARLFIGTDTGVTHLACFLGTPVLCVAHHGTANWLPFYAPGARVLYRFEEDAESHEGEAYLRTHLRALLKPFGEVPIAAVEAVIAEGLRLY